jgi:hypothetical protein
MGSRRNPNITMRAGLTAAILTMTVAGAGAQAPEIDNESKILRCRDNPTSIMFLDRGKLRAKCGTWSSDYTVKTKSGEIERIVYSRYFVVTMRNGAVSSVRKRRHLFTGFGKKVLGPSAQ